MRAAFLAVFAACCLLPAASGAQLNACDLNQDGADNAADVQLATDMTIGAATCPSSINIAGLGVCNVVVVQRVINSALGGTCVTGTGVSPHSVTLNWKASTSLNLLGYIVRRGTTSGGPYTVLNASPLPGTTYTDSTVQAGQTYYYVALAVDINNVQSVYSNEAKAVVPTP